jgi:hypothetical protein
VFGLAKISFGSDFEFCKTSKNGSIKVKSIA